MLFILLADVGTPLLYIDSYVRAMYVHRSKGRSLTKDKALQAESFKPRDVAKRTPSAFSSSLPECHLLPSIAFRPPCVLFLSDPMLALFRAADAVESRFVIRLVDLAMTHVSLLDAPLCAHFETCRAAIKVR